MPAWTCPQCGASWPEDTAPCGRCGRAPSADWNVAGPEGDPRAAAPVLPPGAVQAAVQSSATEPRHPPDLPVWQAPRPFGDLFSSSFGLFFSQSGWIVRFTLLCFLPLLPCALWMADRYLAWHQSDFERMLRTDMAVFSPPSAPDPGNGQTLLIASVAVFLGVAFLCNAFWTAGVLGTLAVRKREGGASLGRAFRAGLDLAPRVAGLFLWTFLRLIPWFLLLIIPGIYKSVVWSFAAPALVTGYARTPEGALAVSDHATRGRRRYLFGFLLLMWLLERGIEGVLSPSAAVTSLLGRGGTFVVLGAAAIATALLGAVQQLGLWLAWTDAIGAPDWDRRAAQPGRQDELPPSQER